MINALHAAPAAVKILPPPDRPGNGWIDNPARQPTSTNMPILRIDEPAKNTVGQADLGFGMNYGARSIRNLQFGSQSHIVQDPAVFGDAFAQAMKMSEGENGAYAVVKQGADLVLRSVLQPAVMHADELGQRLTPFRPADYLQEYDATFDQRVPRATHAVRLLDPSIQAIIDDRVVFDPRAPRLVASGGPVTLDGNAVTVPLTPVG